MQHPERIGSHIDVNNLEETFEGCGFQIKKIWNPTRDEMKEIMGNLRQINNAGYEYEAIFLCILSHGTEGMQN